MKNKEYLYPLKLEPVTKSVIWGGDRLSKKYGKPSVDNLGESWELSVRSQEQNIISNGACKGLKIGQYLEKHTDISPDSFPILTKLIDAGDKLSVQVHPRNEKTEMWHILEADEGATLILGVKDGVDKDTLYKASLDGSIEQYLMRVPVSAGETYFIPAGMIHAIGKGILLAEIQQNSDTTYRFYDYGRGRELHLGQALDNLRSFTDEEIASLQFSKKKRVRNGEILTSCEYFTVIKHKILKKKRIKIKKIPFMSLLCTEGSGIILWKSGKEEIKVGDSFFIPNGVGTIEIRGDLTLITTTV